MDDQAGNTGTETPAAAQPAVDLSPIEARLNRITEAISGINKDNENREIKSRISNAEFQIAQRIRSAEAAINLAENEVAQAHEDGDGAQIARAQRKLTESIADREVARGEKRDFDRARKDLERRSAGSQGAPGTEQQQAPVDAKDTGNLNDWKSRNSSWYGVDVDMTKAAHEIDKVVREAGVIPVGSQEYFKAIDRQMAQKYPDKMRTAPNTGGGNGGGNPTPPSRGGGRIPQSVIDGWARMGINVNDDKALERMVKNREALANKGILPHEPQYGSVITR